MSYTLRAFGLTTPILALLFSCGLQSPKGQQGKVECPSTETSSQGQLCGIAIREILGPRDELLESVPLEQPTVLVASIDDAALDGDATNIREMDPALVFSMLKVNPSTLRIPTDSQGQFSELLEPGEYILCVSYAPPWDPLVPSHQCTILSISKSEPAKISIIFSPDGATLFVQTMH